jgi:hypothetical protein
MLSLNYEKVRIKLMMGALAAKDVSKKAKITLTIKHLSDENILKKLARYFCEYDTRLSDLTF